MGRCRKAKSGKMTITTELKQGSGGEADAVVDTFVRVIAELHGNPDRQSRLLAYVRLRRSPKLVELAKILVWQEETKWHCLEILRRNGVLDEEMPKVEKWNWLKIHGKTGMCLVWVPPGKFMMGSEKGGSDERPVHEVMLSGPLWVGKYAVTNVEYGAYLGYNGLEKPVFWRDPRFNVWDQPVAGVNWEDAQRFGKWSGCGLPSEAEWEYACRSGSDGMYSFVGGEEELGRYGWYGEDGESGSTHGVGLLKPCQMGL